jgi:hypothetical protein
MARPDKLRKQLVDKWRDFASTGALEEGLAYLRDTQAPWIAADTPEKMMHTGIALRAYLDALEDVREVLTTYETKRLQEENDTLSP